MGTLIPFAGARTVCDRCGVPLRVADARREDDNPSASVPRLRLATVPKGVCASCNVCIWGRLLQAEGVALSNLPQALALPHVQQQMLVIFRATRSDPECLEDIDWPTVIASWDLPLPKSRRRKAL